MIITKKKFDYYENINISEKSQSKVYEPVKKYIKYAGAVGEPYKKFGDYNLSANVSAMWYFPDREFSYAEFTVRKVEYNVPVLR